MRVVDMPFGCTGFIDNYSYFIKASYCKRVFIRTSTHVLVGAAPVKTVQANAKVSLNISMKRYLRDQITCSFLSERSEFGAMSDVK